MKICYVLDDTIYRPAGVQYYILNFANYFAENNHQVTILHSENKNINSRKFHPNIKVVKIAEGRDIRGLNLNGSVSPFPGFSKKSYLKKILLENQFDVIHLNYPFSPFISGRLLKVINKLRTEEKIKVKVICAMQIHAEEKFLPRISNHLLAMYFGGNLKGIDTYLHNSTPTKIYCEKYLHSKSRYIPVGIKDIDTKNKQKTVKDPIHILFLGRLEERKGALDFLKALKLIEEKINSANIKIDIVGNGPQREDAEELAKSIKLEIKFHGRVSDEDRDKLYMQAGISVFPAKFGEAFGVVLLEAMNAECSIVGYSNPGYADTLMQYAKDCLVEIDNIEKLAEKLLSFINKPDEKVFGLGKDLKQFFREKYDINVVAKKLEEIYLENN